MAHTLNHQPLLDYLANKGRKYINERDDQGKTALHHAITQNQLELEVVHWLLDYGADKEAKDRDGLTPLHWASREGHTTAVALLLAANADVAAKHQNAYTPLHFAADRGHTAVVELLLNAEKIDIEAQDEEGLTPLYQSIINNHTAVTKLLLAHHANIAAKDQWGATPLHRAVLEGHLSTIALLLEHGAAIASQDSEKYTPLHLAVQQNNTATVSLLLAHGADRKSKNNDGFTPLHYAVFPGYTDILKVLLDHGPNIKHQDIDGLTLLHLAAQQGQKAIVELLLKKGAAIEAKDAAGCTPLHCAAQQGHTAAVELLLTKGANKKASDHLGFTPLHWAVQQRHPIVVELLLIRGADLSIRDIHGKTPRTLAIAQRTHLGDPARDAVLEKVKAMAQSIRSWPLLNYLAGKGAQYINERDSKGNTALHYATNLNKPDIVQWLLDHGADIEAIDADHYTPLHLAAVEGYVAIVKILLEHGADIKARERREWATPLHMAGLLGHQAAVQLLLDHGADATAQSKTGRIPLYFAVENGHSEVASLLRAAQASTALSLAGTAGQTQAAEQSSTQVATPTLATTAFPPLPPNVKDAPALAQVKAELKSTLDIHQAAQETAAAAAQALEEARAATVQAKDQSQASLTHLQTMEQHMARLTDIPPAPRCIALYLQDSVKDAQDYLCALPETDDVVSETQKQQGNRLLATLYARLRQEQQYYRHADRLFLCDATLTEYAQAQLLGEALPQHQYHIDTLNNLIRRFVETAHTVTSPYFVLPPYKATDARSVKSAPVRGHAARQHQDAQSIGAQSAPVRGNTKKSKRNASDSSNGSLVFIANLPEQRKEQQEFENESYSSSECSSKSLGLSSASEEDGDDSSTGTEVQSSDEEDTIEESESQAEAKQKAAAEAEKAFKKRQEEVRKQVDAYRKRVERMEQAEAAAKQKAVEAAAALKKRQEEFKRQADACRRALNSRKQKVEAAEAEAKRKAAALKKRKEAFIKRETARKQREARFRSRLRDSEFGPPIRKTHGTKTTEAKSIKSAPVRGHAARQHQDEQSIGAQSAPTGDCATKQNRVDDHAQREVDILARYIELRVQANSRISKILQANASAEVLMSTSLGLSSDSDSSLSESSGLSSDSEDDSNGSFASSAGAWSSDEEDITEESSSQAETKRKAAAESNARHELGLRTNSSHHVISEQYAVLLSRIMQLGVGLPASQKRTLQENIAPILQEKLLPVPAALREKVFHYFQEKGTIYPRVLCRYPVQDWVSMSLLHDLVQGTLPSDASHTRFHTLSKKLKEQYSAEILEAILWICREKKAAHTLSLDELCDVTEMLPRDGVYAKVLLQLPEDQWLTSLKRAYLHLSIETHCPYFNVDQRQYLVEELSHLTCSLQVTQTLLRQLPQVHNPKELSHLLAFMAQYPIEEGQIMEVLTTSTSAADSLVAYWHHQLACSLLKEKLSRLLPQELRESTYAMIEKIWEQAPTYQAINTFLEKLYLRRLQEDGFVLDAEHLHLVLSMMQDYRLDEAIYSMLLQQLVGLPSHQWGQYFYTQILQQCFGAEAYERTTSEIIEYMAQHSPEVAYVQDQAKLTQAYQNILDAYQKDSTTLPGGHAIASWDAATVTKWAQTVKDYAKDPAKGTFPLQCELIAVVKRAVELHHGYTPRNTQLLSLLVLLNSTLGKGRLLQINTGEGKSLTVAMFAAIQTLLNKKSDVVTTSTELSIPEVGNQRPFFEMLALSVAENSGQGARDTNTNKQKAYQQDNVYGTPADFQGDILRTEFFGKEMRMRRSFEDTVVVVDEVDNMLFDGRSRSICLSINMPATNHLSILLAVVWQQVRYWNSHFIADRDKVYLIEEDFHKDPNGHITILSGEERDPQRCMQLFEGDVENFIKEMAQYCLDRLLRDLNEDEQAAYAASKKLEREITILRMSMDSESDPDKHKNKADQLARLESDHQALPWNAEKNKSSRIISVPAHLKGFAKQQVPKWIQSAITALIYKKGCHYDVQGGKIVPVDYNNTGVWQHNMVWSNGLAQFLQMKEGLKILPENISTNFISTVGFFQRYANQLYGLTGTLGNEVTQAFFSKVYNTDLVIVPPYKQRLIVGNASSSYACKELTPRLITDQNTDKWYEAIEASALQHAQQQRAVLIICKYIRQAHNLEERLQKHYARDKIFAYTGKGKFVKNKVYPGEIIIATNIAGRGTDLTPSELVEHHGGLHVCITFLPENYRVELQNAGRTARKGSKGTTQLILHQPEATTIEALRQQRDEKEAKDLQKAIDEVERMTFKDKLFQRFCQVENKLLPTLGSFERMRHSRWLEEIWAEYAKQALAPTAVQDFYNKRITELAQNELNAIPSNQWSSLSSVEKQAKKDDVVRQMRVALPFEKFQEDYVIQKRREAMQELQTEIGIGILHPDVVTAFQEGRRYVPENGELADKYDWGPYERKAVEERFGLWFHAHVHQSKELIDTDAVNTAFDAFLKEIQEDAKANKLIHNPYFYVQKGNALLQPDASSAAVSAYNKAIAGDPDFSLHARHNKAMALLTPKKNKSSHTEVLQELQEAKILIEQYKERLCIFQAIIGNVEVPRPYTAQHLQHHLDILFQQEHHINAAVSVIDSARSNNNHVKITENIEVASLFDKNAAQEHREQALEEVRENGLSYFFIIAEKKPRPWFSICAVALIGLVQIAAAVVATLGTAGAMTMQLLSSGISDLITAITSAISGEFSWKDWGISKAISIAVSIISFGISEGWSKIKEGIKGLKESIKTGIKEVRKMASKKGAQAVKKALIKQAKSVACELGKGVGKACTIMLVRHGVQESLGEILEEKITQAVSQSIMQSVLNNELIRKAMAHDTAQGRDYWAQILIKEGLSMLNEKDSAWQTILKGIIEGTALKQLTKHIEKLHGQGTSKTAILTDLASLSLPMLSGFLMDINGFTDTFLAKFHERLAQKYGQELANIETTTQENKKENEDTEVPHVDNSDQEFMYVMDAQEHPDDEELQLLDRHNGQAFSTQAKVAPQQVVIDAKTSQEDRTKTVGQALTNNVSAQLLGKVHQHIINPLISFAAGSFIDRITSDVTARVRQQRESAINVHQVNREGNERANLSAEADQSVQIGVAEPEVKALQEADKHNEGDITRLPEYAKILEKVIEYKKSDCNKLEYSFGTEYQSDGKSAIQLDHIANPNITEATDIKGHWMGSNSAIEVTLSGPRNCLEDAIVAQLTTDEKKKLEIYTGQDLRDRRVAYLAAHPIHAQQADQHYQTLLYYDPSALMRGGGVWANTATSLQGMESWLDKHPALLSLVQNAGSVVGGAMWLKNLTPAGVVGYLVTNYGYEKVLKLLDGNVEVGKEHLYNYFLAHDKDITPDQARYLANVSMQGLLAGGRVAVHQVAAAQFKTGRKPKKQDSKRPDSQKQQDPKSKKKRTGEENVPEKKQERIEARDVAQRGGGSVVEQGKVEGAENAYEIAKAGGKHNGCLKSHINLPDVSLKKGIRSFQRQIDKHKLLIEDPQHYLEVFNKTKGYPPWHQMNSGRRTTLLKEIWPLEIKKFEAQKQILEQILKNRP
jgi:ankyrin repeat protein/preprotein translocase subunit SecA